MPLRDAFDVSGAFSVGEGVAPDVEALCLRGREDPTLREGKLFDGWNVYLLSDVEVRGAAVGNLIEVSTDGGPRIQKIAGDESAVAKDSGGDRAAMGGDLGTGIGASWAT